MGSPHWDNPSRNCPSLDNHLLRDLPTYEIFVYESMDIALAGAWTFSVYANGYESVTCTTNKIFFTCNCVVVTVLILHVLLELPNLHSI